MSRALQNFTTSFAAVALIFCAASAAGAAPEIPPPEPRANELTVATFRPGRDSLDAANKKFPSKWTGDAVGSGIAHSWIDTCSNRKLSIESDDSGTIQSVTIESLVPSGASNCDATAKRASLANSEFWKTGHGLRLGDTRQRVLEIYGKPGSAGPSVKNGRELELLYYAFDWAGPDVPQVMEISCDRASGRVVEIMLAFPSL